MSGAKKTTAALSHAGSWPSRQRIWSRRVPGPELKSMIMVESVREMGGKRTSERRFYISSLAPDSRQIGDAIRAQPFAPDCLRQQVNSNVCAVHGTNPVGCKSRCQAYVEPKVSQRASASSRGGVR